MNAIDMQGEPVRGLERWMPERREDEPASPLVALQIAQAVTNAKVDEVGRLVNELRQEIRDLKTTFATKAEMKAEMDPMKADLHEVKEWQKWIVRIIVGGFLAAVGGTIYVKGGVPHP